MKSSILAVQKVTVSPGTGTDDSVIASKNGFFVATIKFELNSATAPDPKKIIVKLNGFKVGNVDKSGKVAIKKIADFKIVKKDNNDDVYEVTGICSIRSNPKNLQSIAFDRDLTFNLGISLDNGTSYDPVAGVDCVVKINDNTGVKLDNLMPQFINDNAVIDTNPVDGISQPSSTNPPVLIQFKSLNSNSVAIPNAYINIETFALPHLYTADQKYARFFVMKGDGSAGEEIFWEKNGFGIRTSIRTDSLGIAVIGCYPTQLLSDNEGVIQFDMELTMPSGATIDTTQRVVLLTGVNFHEIDESIIIEDKKGNNVDYDPSKTGLKTRFPEYQDHDPNDIIIVINKEYGAGDNTVRVCAALDVNEGDIFNQYLTEISYLKVVANKWNATQFMIIQGDNVKISVENLWKFNSPDIIDVEPPAVTPTEPVPQLIFTAEDGVTIENIGEQYGYSLNSSCVNYGGKLELKLIFDSTHIKKNDVVSVSYGIKAFQEGDGHRKEKNAKETLTDPTWIITDEDITNNQKIIKLPQNKFVGYDEDENGDLGHMWLMATVGLACYTDLLRARIDTVGPGE